MSRGRRALVGTAMVATRAIDTIARRAAALAALRLCGRAGQRDQTRA